MATDSDNNINTTLTIDNSQFVAGLKDSISKLSQLGNIDKIFEQQFLGMANVIRNFNQITGATPTIAKQVEKQFQLLMDQAKGLVPTMNDLSLYSTILGKDFVGVDYSSSLLVKGLKSLESQGEVTQKSLSNFADTVGSDSEKLIPFTNQLKSVYNNLAAIPEISSKYSAAQSEIIDSTKLTQRTMQLMGGTIADIGVGYLALSSGISTVGTTISSQEEFFKNLSKENKNLASTTKEWMEVNKENPLVLQKGLASIIAFQEGVSNMKAMIRGTSEELVKTKGSLEVFGKEGLSQSQITRQLGAEQSLLTKAYYNVNTILKVLDGTQKTETANLLEIATAALKGRQSVAELANVYPAMQSGIQKVTQDQEFLSNTVKMFSENYAPVYGKVFQDIAETSKLSGNELVQLATKIEIVAQNSAGLITISEQVAKATIANIEANTQLDARYEERNSLLSQAVGMHQTFANTLLSEEAITTAVTTANGTLESSLLSYVSSIEKASSASGDFTEASKALIPVSQGIRTAQEQLKISYDGTGDSSKALVKTSSDLSTSFASLQTVFGKVHKDFGEGEQAYAGFTAASEKVVKANQRTQESVFKLSNFFQKLWDTVKNYIVFQAASMIVSGFINTLTNAVVAASEFDQSLHNLKAITGATSAEMAGMSDVIKEMAASSVYSTKDIAEGLTIMAQAGLTVGESVSTIKSATNLATGTLEKMSQTVDLITSTMSSYNISALESGRVSDVLAIAVNKSKLSVDKLRTSLNYVGVIAAQSGLSLEQTSASLMVLADRGMKASTIGTGFRQVLDKLIAPNEKLREAYQAHGIALDKISPLTAGYEEALKNLSVALYDSDTQTVNTSKAFELFGIRGAQAAAILIQSYTSGEWKDAMNSFNESGTAAKMAAEQMLGLGAMWDNLVAKTSVLLASLGEGGLTFVLKGLVSFFSLLVDGIQAFLNFDFGNLGLLTQIVIGLTAIILTSSSAVYLYNIAWTMFSMTLETRVIAAIAKLIEKIYLMNFALNANTFVLVVTAIASVVAAFKIYSYHLDSIIEGHNKLANESKQMVDTLELLQKAVGGMTEGSTEYETLLKRITNEYPELAKEITKLTGVTDISTLSHKDLIAAMEKIKVIKLNESINEHTEALRELTNQVTGVGALFVYFGEVLGRIKQMYEFVAGAINLVVNAHKTLANIINPVSEEMIAANKKTSESVKVLAKDYVDYGKSVQTTIEDQKKASMERLQLDFQNQKFTIEIYKELVKNINISYDQIAKRLELSKIHYERFANSIEGIYGELTAKQRAEIQSVLDEEEKAVEKFTKFANDKKIAVEDKESEIYAIRLQYQLKALGLLSDSTKKEYETQKEKFAREEDLINKKLELVKSKIAKETAEYQKYEEWKTTGLGKFLATTKNHLNNIATLEATTEDLIRAQRNVTFEHQKKLMNDVITEIKSNASLQLTLLEGVELEKIRLVEAEADAVLAAKNMMLQSEKDYIAERIANNKATDAQIEASNERQKTLILEITQAQKDSITARIADVKLWVAKSNEYEAQRLEYSKDLIKQEQELLKRNYDEQVANAKSALDRRLVLISTEKQASDVLYGYYSVQEQELLRNKLDVLKSQEMNSEEFVQREYDLKNEYYQKGLQRYQEDSNKQISLAGFTSKSILEIEAQKQKARIAYYTEIDAIEKDNLAKTLALEEKDLQNTIRITNEKFLIEQTTSKNLQDLQNLQADFSQTTQAKILQVTAEGNSARIELAKQETIATKSEYSVREEALLNSIAKSGRTVLEDITLRGSALLEETKLTKKELSEREISWVSYGDKVYRVLDAQSVATQSAVNSQKAIVKKGIDDQIISIRTVTTESIAELKKQGVQYEVFNGQVIKTTTGTYAEIKKNFTNLTDDEKKMFIQLEKDILTSLETRKKAYLDYVTEAKKNIESLKTAEVAALQKIDELMKNKKTINESYADANKKNLQTLMTDEQKFADNVKTIYANITQARLTDDAKYLLKAKSDTEALIGLEVKEGDKIIKTKEDVSRIVSDLLRTENKLALELNEKEIKKTKEAAEAIKAKYEELQKSVEEAKVKIEALSTMKVEIETTSFLTSTKIIFEELDKIIEAIKGVKQNAIMEINDTKIKEQLAGLSASFASFKTKVDEVKNNPVEIKIEDAGLTDAINAHLKELEELKKTQGLIKEVNFGQVESWETLKESLNANKISLEGLMNYISEKFKPIAMLEFKASGIEGKEKLSEVITDVKAIPSAIDEAYKVAPKPTLVSIFNMDIGDGIVRTFQGGFDFIGGLLKKLTEKPTKSEHNVVVTGILDLQAAIDKHSQLDGVHTDSYHTVHVTTVEDGESGEDGGNQRTGGYIAARVGGFIQHLRKGGAFSGSLPGYGGGDIVNARLEPGEFVLRKEAVQNIGVNALRQWNNLNSSAMKSLNPQSGSSKTDSLFTGQLHTVNLNIGDQSHKVYAEPNVLNSLTSSLRRARLMKA